MRNRYHDLFSVLFCALLVAESSCSFAASNILQISYGERHFCAITTNGELLCWGDNTLGAIGNGKFSRSLPDARVYDPTLIIPAGVAAVSAGYGHTCAIVSESLQCWGSNTSGQIGNGQIDPDGYRVGTTKPVQIIASGVKAVAAGGSHTCAIVGEALLCWGGNWSGQIGNRSAGGNIKKPVQVLDSGVTAVAAWGHTCAVVRGDLLCWGSNRNGQIGNGTSEKDVLSPVKIISGGVTAVAASQHNTCAIVKGALLCWGANDNGQIDPDSKGNVLTPRQIISGRVTAVAVTGGRFCAVVGGALQCWGHVGTGGVLGIATSDHRASIKRPQELIPSGVTAVGMGERGTCVLVDGALRCRGYDPYLNDDIRPTQFAQFNLAAGDIRTLNHADSDRALAQEQAPARIAEFMASHHVIYHQGTVYYTSVAATGLSRPGLTLREEPGLKLNFDAIPLFRNMAELSAAQQTADGGTLALAPDATCGRDAMPIQMDTTEFHILTGSSFTNLRDALLPSIPVLPQFSSPANAFRISEQDLKKIQGCSGQVEAALNRLPFAAISYSVDDKDVAIPRSLARTWSHDGNGSIRRISVTPKPGMESGFSALAYAVLAMQCGDRVLTQWKQWQSPPLDLQGPSFGVNSNLLMAGARDFPAHPLAELRRAIHAEQGQAGLAPEEEARKCLPAVIGEKFLIRYRDEVVQQISISLPAPAPVLKPDCEQAVLCRPVPDDSSKRIVILMPASNGSGDFGRAPATMPAEDDQPGDIVNDDYDLSVFIVGNEGEIYSRYLEKKAYASGAALLKGFTLDTGRYKLAHGIRAFGLRAEYADPNSLAPQGETTLKLFVREGGALRMVLNGLVTDKAGSSWSGACTGASSRVSRIIDIGAASSHGYADLVVTSTANVTENRMSGGQCAEKSLPPRTETATLHYDGRQYVIPVALRAAQ